MSFCDFSFGFLLFFKVLLSSGNLYCFAFRPLNRVWLSLESKNFFSFQVAVCFRHYFGKLLELTNHSLTYYAALFLLAKLMLPFSFALFCIYNFSFASFSTLSYDNSSVSTDELRLCLFIILIRMDWLVFLLHFRWHCSCCWHCAMLLKLAVKKVMDSAIIT